ncbi:hypothetical protein CVT25_006335 [Psilocybe cyanescens]|uniref:Uncharacterized protein n=1 Tax=Psilocybe cyanescens TaxID=93625 RepID=A0A409X3U1_PSICY|nr:hypothetical protein CVT25_006335 [Psilocybe cyanescens]
MPALILIVITYSTSSSSSPLSALMSLEIINQIHNKLCVITINPEEYKHELKELFEQLRRAYWLHTSEHGNSLEPDSALWFDVYTTLMQGINKGLNGNERLRPRYEQVQAVVVTFETRYEQVQALVVAFEKDEGKDNQMRADEQSNPSKAASAVLSGDQHDGSIAEAAIAATNEVQIEEAATTADDEVQTEPVTAVIPTTAAANSSKPSRHWKIMVVEIPPRKAMVTRNPALSDEEEGNLNKSRNHPTMKKGKGKEVLRMESDDEEEEEVESFGTTINFEMADDLSEEVFNPNARAVRWILEDMERNLRVVRDDSKHLMLEFQKLKETVN